MGRILRFCGMLVVAAAFAWTFPPILSATPPPASELAVPQQQKRLEEFRRLLADSAKLEKQGQLSQAVPLAKQALAILKVDFGEEHVATAQVLHYLGNLYHSMSDYAAARPFYEQALAIRKKVLGENHADTAQSLNYLGLVLYAAGEYAAARPCLEQALAINREVLGEKHPNTAQSLNNLGALLNTLGDYKAARKHYEQALAINKEVFGEKHANTAVSLNNLGKVLSNMGGYTAARPYYEQALAINKEVFGEKHANTATSLNNLGFLLSAMGNNLAARPYFEQALEIRKEMLGEKHPGTAAALNNLGALLHEMGEHGAARSCYEQALAINKEALGNKHPVTASSHNNLAALLKALGDYAAAQPHYAQALAINRIALGDKHPETARSIDNLGSLLQEMDDYPAARSYHEQALAIRKEVLGEKHPDTVVSFTNLGCLLIAMGDYAAARPYLEDALAIRKEVLGERHPGTAASLNNLGMLLQAMGDYAAARPYLEEALAIRKEILGEKHPDTVLSLNNLATFLQLIGDYAAARSYLEDALAIQEVLLGKKHPHTVTLLSNLGVLLEAMGDYGAARPYLEEALTIRNEVLGEKHRDTAASLNNLGGLLQAMRDYPAARLYLEDALAIRKEVLGEKHADTAHSLSNLGMLLYNMGDFEEARPCLLQALAIRTEVLGEKHPDTALSLNNLSTQAAALNEWPEAARLLDQARHVIRRHVSRVLPGLSQKEQLTFLQTSDKRPWYAALSLASQRNADEQIVELSAGWLLNGKAVAQESLAQQTLLARDGSNPALAGAVQELLAVRRQWAALSMAASKPGDEKKRNDTLAQLERQEQELSRRVSQQEDRPLTDDPWVELAAVRQALAEDSVLVDIARFSIFDFHALGNQPQWGPERYVAWIIPAAGRGDVQIVDLGEARAIDAAVQAFRQGLEQSTGTRDQPGVISKQGEADAETTIQEPLQQLAKLVLTPLTEHLEGVQNLVLSPDGALWLVPWGALPIGDGQYAIEKYNIRYVVSGRDVLAMKSTAGKINEPVILADPNFDLSPKDAEAASRAVLRSAYEPPTGAGHTATSEASKLPQVGRLPGTAVEAQAIAPKLEKYAGKKPQVYSKEFALESVFKKVARPKVAILSTHGFFLPEQEVKRDENAGLSSETRSAAITTDGKPIENPLLRCGLLLAGCNQSGGAAGGDDGILTGLEIVGTDLRGTELVVLSACETGLGEVRNGQGVAGLRQAFQLAGAQAVVSTLWQIPDRESAQLMVRFFDNLAEGKSKSDALRDAQLTMIQSRREKNGAAHPFFWAAYTLTGN